MSDERHDDPIQMHDGQWWDRSDLGVCGLIYAGSRIPRGRIDESVVRCRQPSGHTSLHDLEVSPGRFRFGTTPLPG